jgi:hypothetical protein
MLGQIVIIHRQAITTYSPLVSCTYGQIVVPKSLRAQDAIRTSLYGIEAIS